MPVLSNILRLRGTCNLDSNYSYCSGGRNKNPPALVAVSVN